MYVKIILEITVAMWEECVFKIHMEILKKEKLYIIKIILLVKVYPSSSESYRNR